MSDTESFEQAMTIFRENLTGMYDNGHMTKWADIDTSVDLDRLKAAHDREIRDTAQQQFARGFNAGQHSMDAEHRAISMRLRGLRFDGGSHENLSQIARAVYHADFGWTKGACAALRDKLIDLMGGVSDENVHVGGLRCDDGCMGDVSNGEDTGRAHDSPSNRDRNHMAVREGVDTVIGDGDDTCACADGGACAAADCDCVGKQAEVSDGGCEWLRDGTISDSLIPVWHCAGKDGILNDGRTADDSAADSRGGAGGELVHMDGVTITDELRECVDKAAKTYDESSDEYGCILCYISKARLLMIADRIDKRAKHDRESDRLRIEKLQRQRDDLCAKLDEYDSTRVELPRDKNGEVFRVDGGARVDDLVLTIRQMTLTKSGWKIRAYDEDYEVEQEASFFDACAPKPDLIEEIIERLTLGEITQSEAIERIKSLGQE